jgi:hypothetical protein
MPSTHYPPFACGTYPHLRTKRVRVDSTNASGYMTVIENGLFQFGHSKDHRPDLFQLKPHENLSERQEIAPYCIKIRCYRSIVFYAQLM